MDGPEQSAPRPDPTTGHPRHPAVGKAGPVAAEVRRPALTQPVAVDTSRIVLAGLGCWAVALVVVLAVPSLHTGPRDWWPWACVSGFVLGLLGLAYVRRGRGNAAGARRG